VSPGGSRLAIGRRDVSSVCLAIILMSGSQYSFDSQNWDLAIHPFDHSQPQLGPTTDSHPQLGAAPQPVSQAAGAARLAFMRA
jgi:hypothetical protein